MALKQSAIINYSANGVGTWYEAKAKPKGGQPSASARPTVVGLGYLKYTTGPLPTKEFGKSSATF